MRAEAVESWDLSSVGFFRGMGFFVGMEGLSDEGLSRNVKSIATRDWGSPLPPEALKDPQAADMFLVMADRSRAWFRDLECAYMGSNAYVEALQEWSAISRGTFLPGIIGEVWEAERGPAAVAFTARGRRYRFLHRHGDMIDMRILGLINDAIGDTGYAFEACDNLGMPNIVLVLTEAEKARLVRERGWASGGIPRAKDISD